MKRRSRRRQSEQAQNFIELSAEEWGVINAIKSETIDKRFVDIVKDYAARCNAAGISDDVFVSTLVLSILLNLVKTFATLKGVPHEAYIQNRRLFQNIARALQDAAEGGINECMHVSGVDR